MTTETNDARADDAPRCRQFWRYTGQGEDPKHVALECNIHGVIPGATAADTDERVAEVWARHLISAPAVAEGADL